jgi:molybdopterin synthase sulfur carrier subunit
LEEVDLMPVAFVPAPLRSLTGDRETVEVTGATVGQVVDELERRYPGIKARLCQGEELRPGIAVFVDTEIAPLGLLQPVQKNSEIHFLPAISGGKT